jgi:ferredoxin like protein
MSAERDYREPSLDERLSGVDFTVSPRAHITVDTSACRTCPTRVCVHVCPAALFVPTTDGGVLFNHEQCLECGTCYQVCAGDGAISWSYPDGGYGVHFRKG